MQYSFNPVEVSVGSLMTHGLQLFLCCHPTIVVLIDRGLGNSKKRALSLWSDVSEWDLHIGLEDTFTQDTRSAFFFFKGPICNKLTVLNHKMTKIYHQRLRTHAKLKYFQQCYRQYILSGAERLFVFCPL